jgi:hypothetical protein
VIPIIADREANAIENPVGRGFPLTSRQHRPESCSELAEVEAVDHATAIRLLKTRQNSKSQLFQFLFRFDIELISDHTPGALLE